MKKISIIIPNWNGRNILGSCLGSIKHQSYRSFEVIIVDNGSTDGSINYVKKEYSQYKIIVLKDNVGFARAVNVGVKASRGDLVALLNNDTEADKHWLREIANAAVRHPEATFFASKMMDYKRRNIIDSCGDAMTWTGRSYKIGEGKKDSAKYQKERYIFGACAGAAAYRKEFFDKVGYFDEVFFAYLEDVDLDFRAQLLGLKCLFVPSAIVYHIGSATAGRGSGFAFRQMIRNHIFLIIINFPIRYLWHYGAKIIYSELRLLAAAWREGYLGEYLRAMGDVLVNFKRMLAKRASVQRNIKISFIELSKVVEAEFVYKPISQAAKDALESSSGTD